MADGLISRGVSWGASFSTLAGAGVAVYDEVMVPRMFDPWARLLVDVLEVAPGQRVLDVACGPGTVARVAAERVGAPGRVMGCDLSQGMLERARSKRPAEGAAPVEYRQAPADALPVDDGEFDVVTCHQGLQFFTDRVAAAREMRRALTPSGRAGVAIWRSLEHCPPFAALGAAITEVAGPEAARRYRDGPFGFGDAEAVRAVFPRAGFAEVEVSVHTLPIRFEGGPEQVVSTLAVTPLAEAIDQLPAEQRHRLVDRVAEEVGAGPVESTMQAHIALARL